MELRPADEPWPQMRGIARALAWSIAILSAMMAIRTAEAAIAFTSLGAGVLAALLRPDPRSPSRLGAVLWWLLFVGIWFNAWWWDFRFARFQIVLALPIVAAVVGAGLGRLLSGRAVAGMGALAMIGAYGTWVLAAERANSADCGGVSSSYSFALVFGAILLYGVGPFLLGGYLHECFHRRLRRRVEA